MKPTNDLNIRKSIAIMVLAATFAACSGDSTDTTRTTNPNDGVSKAEINIDVTNDSRQTKAGRRINAINSDTELESQDIRINAYFHNTATPYLSDVKLHYATGTWGFVDGSDNALHYYWPIEGSVYDPSTANITVSSLDFVGFCPYTQPGYISELTHAARNPGFTCDLSSYMTTATQSGITEFMYAYLDAQTYADQTTAGGALPLEFHHPFSLVTFNISSESGTAVTVNTITISGLKTSGTFQYSGGWSSLTGSEDLEISEELNLNATTETDPYLVIPNDYGPLTITVNATWNDWSSNVSKDVSTSVNFNWEPGKSYTYTLTLQKYGLKVETTQTFTEQW